MKFLPVNHIKSSKLNQILNVRVDEEIASLLTSWVDVAKRLNHPGRSAAAALQAVAFHTPEN